ncbi:MAG: hypothetical protein V4534_00850 [Myxococcota bacterium]
MATIIKSTEKPAQIPVTRSVVVKGKAYKEQQDIKELYVKAFADRRSIIDEAKQQAVLAKEQAQVEGANEAFAEAAEMAVQIFMDRAKECADLKAPLTRLSAEISKKILGGPLSLDKANQESVINDGIQKLRSRRKLKIQVSNPETLAAIQKQPDFEIEAATDLPPGFLRVVTEVGSALWDEGHARTKIISMLGSNSANEP